MVGFIFGGNTGETAESLADKRGLAAAMLKSAMSGENIQSPWQGASQLAKALVGGLMERQITNESAARNAQWTAALLGQPYSPPTPSTDFRDKAANWFFGDTSAPGVSDQLRGSYGKFLTGQGNAPSAPAPQASAPANIINPGISGTTPPVQPLSYNNDGTELGSYLSDASRRATLPAGMRNNNPGNIKYVGQKVPGIVGPSQNTDQGDPQAVFDTPESGMRAMYSLLSKKYAGGKLTPNDMIAGEMGWTPGNYQAAANVARTMGIGPNDDIGFNDPNRAAQFMHALILQEHGQKGNLYPTNMITAAIGGNASPASAPAAAYAPSPQANNAAAAIEAIAPQQSRDPIVSAPNYNPSAPNPLEYNAPQQSAAPAAAAIETQSPQSQPATSAPSAPPVQVAQNVSMDKGYFPPAPQAPAQNAAPTQGIQSPRLAAAMAAMASPYASPQVKSLAQALIQQEMTPQNEFQTTPDGNILMINKRTGQVQPVYRSAPKPMEVNGHLVDPTTGRDIADYSNPQTSVVGDALVDQKTGKVIYQGTPKAVTVEPGVSLVNPLTGQEVYHGSGYKPGDVSELRKEIQNLPSYKSYQMAAPSYQSMVETAKTDSKASDLNLVYGLGKIMDPNSVVREGEMVMVQNASSLPDWVQGAINSVNGGARLEPATRQAILREAHSRIAAYRQALDTDINQYRGIVGRRGMNPDDVIPALNTVAGVPELSSQEAGKTSDPVKVQSPEDAAKLPSGTVFVTPDGRVKVRP